MSIKFDNHFLITYNKANFNTITPKYKKHCKVLRFLSLNSLDEMLLVIADLSSYDFPYLFFFIFEAESFGFCGKYINAKPKIASTIEKFLLKFNKNRPIILQLESKNENVKKIFYKDENICEFSEVNQQLHPLENLHHFPNFYSLIMNGDIGTIDDVLLDKLIKKTNSSLCLRLLRTLIIHEDSLFKKIIFKCAAHGSKNQLLASLDIAFEFTEHELNQDALNYLSKTCYLSFESDELEQSILLTAVENHNIEIVNFLLTTFKSLLIELPIVHQIDISNIAFDTNQIEVLCTLLEYDFPFPDNFNSSSISDKRFQKIIDNRKEFHQWIDEKNFANMDEFIENNSNLKMIYNVQNNSALHHALNSKSYDVYYYLKSYGLKGENLSFTQVATSEKELENVQIKGIHQRRKNVMNAIPNEDNSIMILIAKCFIHNQTMSDKEKWKYKSNIEKWFKEINRTEFGAKIFHVASQCEDLIVIFDFDNETVHNIDLNATNSLGMTYPHLKRIFIGAQSSDFKNREQKIKGVMLHEVCHYALQLVFENNENPYYEYDEEKAKEYEKIISAYKKYGETKPILNDECEGILSNVYKKYKEEEHSMELIVIAAQIQAQYDNDKEKRIKLESKFDLLFKFMKNHVMPEMEKFNFKNRIDVRNFNHTSGIFSEIKKLSINIKIEKHATNFTGNKYVIVTTNVQKLYFLNVYFHLQKIHRNLLNARNIFTTADIIENTPEFNQLLIKTKPTCVFIDCTKQFIRNLSIVKKKKFTSFIFIVKCDAQCEEIEKILQHSDIKAEKSIETFNWNDLDENSKNFLIQSKVVFQRCVTLSLKDIIETDGQHITKNIFEELIDDNLLNLLVENKEIVLNAKISDQLTDMNFKSLFQPRKFLKVHKISNNQKTNEKITLLLTHDQLLDSVKNEKFVIISDIAGTGKSWQMLKMEEVLQNFYPKKWTSYVDLKQHIKAFKSAENHQDFSSFMIQHVLKPVNKFESKIFSNLYENGNVLILFDGFDEIAPDCVKFVHKLIKSFMFNNGNQLWIATRDYFEHDLKENLKINIVYKLEKFTQEENIFMLTSNWILHDLQKKSEDFPENNFLEWIKSYPNFESYQKTAQNLSSELLCSEVQSIGSPLFYKMSADIFKDDRSKIMKVTVPEVYKTFVKVQILRWAKEQGEIRENASVEQNISKVLNHREVHQLYAMISLFPESSEFCDLDIIDCNWRDEEIVACGVVSKKDGTFYFPHETFREYYASDFVIRVISGRKPDIDKLCKYLIIFLTIEKYGVIRMFLNEAISDDFVKSKINLYMTKISKYFYANNDMLTNLSNIFEENLENLGYFLFDLLKHGKFEDIKGIFNNNKGMINIILDSKKLFEHFQDLMINKLNAVDSKQIILDFKIYQKLASSTIDEEITKRFILEIEDKTDSSFSNEALKIQNEFGDNVLFCSVQSNYNGIRKIKSLFETLQNSICDDDLIDLMKQCNNKGWNILHAVINSNDNDKLVFLWQTLKIYFSKHNSLQDFKDLCTQKSDEQKNILHISVNCQSIEFHELLWNHLLSKEILTLEELKQLIIQKDQNSDNFVHSLITTSNACIIEMVLTILKNNLNEEQYLEILYSKGAKNRNLLQVAAGCSKEIQTHKFLWKIFKDSCKSSDEFWKILEETDESDNNILNIASSFTTKDILVFIDEELDKIASNDEIKRLYCNLNINMRSMFQLISKKNSNKSLEFCKTLWIIMRKRFNSTEIMEIITHRNKYGNNMLIVTLSKNTKEISSFTWYQISNFIKENFALTAEENSKLNLCDAIISNFVPSNNVKGEEKEILKFKWLKNNKTTGLFEKYYQLNETVTIKTLMSFTSNESLESHKNLWQHLVKTFEDRSKLINLLSEKDLFGDQFLITLVKAQKLEIIEYTFKTLKEILKNSQYNEIVRSKGQNNRHLFQRTALLSKDQKIYKFLWAIFKETCLTTDEFLNIIRQGNETDNNILNLCASFGSKENFEFIIEELKNLTSKDEIKSMFCKLTVWNQNILQIASKRNRSLDLHKYLWEQLHNYFNSFEILQFVKHIDARGNSLLLVAIELNSNDVIKLTWQETFKILQKCDSSLNELSIKQLNQCDTIIKNISKSNDIKEDEKEILKLKWIDSSYSCLFKFALVDEHKLIIKSISDLKVFMSDNNSKNHEILWNHLFKNYKNHEKLKNLLADKYKNDEPYLHLLVYFNNSNVIEQTLKILKENLNDSQLQEILNLKDSWKRSLLQKAIISKKLKVVELLWKTFSNLCKSSNEFFEILLQIDEYGNNICNLAACYTTIEIFNFIREELERLFSRNEIVKLMTNENFEKLNLLHSVCMYNKSIKFHEIIWKIIDKYFNSLEKIEFINSFDKNEFHFFSIALNFNTKEIVNLSWNKIINILDKKDDQMNYLNNKGIKDEYKHQLALENIIKDIN